MESPLQKCCNLLQLHGGEVVFKKENVDGCTILVECDRYGIGAYWKDGRRVYSMFVIYQHIETHRVMTRESLDDVPIFEGMFK